MTAKLNSMKLTLALEVMLVISVRLAYGETGACPFANVTGETTFMNGIRLDFYPPNKPLSMFKLSFTGGGFHGEGFCFTWDEGKRKYRIETPSGSQLKDFGRAGKKTLRIRVTDSNKIILVDETNLETLNVNLKKARRDTCYTVALRSQKIIPHMFMYSGEGQYCDIPAPTTTATTLQPSPPTTPRTTSTPPPSSTTATPTTELHGDTAPPSSVTPADKENQHQEDALSKTERDVPLPLGSTAASYGNGCSAIALLFLALRPMDFDLF